MITAIRRAARTDYATDVSRARATADVVALKGLLDACEAAGVERHALVLGLSRLPPDLCRPHHIRLAREAIQPLMMCDRARLFHPTPTDSVVVWRGEAGPNLAAARAAVAHLFSEGFEGDANALTEPLRLPRDAVRLRRLLARAAPAEPAEASCLPAMDLAGLASLEGRLAQADLTRFARRRTVRRVAADGQASLAWEERRLALPEIAAEWLPGTDIRADPWLFRRLTRTLDRRMLALLTVPGALAEAAPFSLPLTVATLLAPEFLAFDTALPRRLRGQVVIELEPADVLADTLAFAFARDLARARGHRVLIRLVSPSQLDLLPAERLGVDLTRLRWTEALADWTPPESIDGGSLVLGRGGGARAQAWGRAHGVALFAGEG